MTIWDTLAAVTIPLPTLQYCFQGRPGLDQIGKETMETMVPEMNLAKARAYGAHPTIQALHQELATLPRCAEHGTVRVFFFILVQNRMMIYFGRDDRCVLLSLENIEVGPLSPVV